MKGPKFQLKTSLLEKKQLARKKPRRFQVKWKIFLLEQILVSQWLKTPSFGKGFFL